MGQYIVKLLLISLWIGQSAASLYHFDEEQKVARFFPTNKAWTKKLHPVEYFYSFIYPSGGVCFKGTISIQRFLEAMQSSLQDFDFLFGRFYMDSEGLGVRYLGGNDERNNSFVQLEIEERVEDLCSSTLKCILPDKIDDRMRNIFVDRLEALEGLGLAAFKLTTFRDGFALGYYFNHAFFDQSSIVYFLQYLSHRYTHGDWNNPLKKPTLMDFNFQTAKAAPVFKDLIDIRKYGESALGRRYRSEKPDNSKTLSQPNALQRIDVRFNIDAINKLKNSTEQFISSNDIIHALLFKIYSFNPDFLPDNIFYMTFICNMRKRCGLGDEAIGNILNPIRICTRTDYIANATILELANLSRKCIYGINVEDFKNNLVWYDHIQKYKESPMDYPTPASDPLNRRVSNWSTFNYDHILFDDARIVSLKTPASAALAIISFDNIGGEKVFTTSLYVPPHSLKSIIELGRSTNLFIITPEITTPH